MSYNSVEDYVKNAENNRNTAVLNSLLESEPGMKELPEITPEDEGKILQVNNGKPSWGGGSSGGGVLVVHETVTTSGDETIHTLDKTWQEIHDADFAVLKTDSGMDGMIYYACAVGVEEGEYYVLFMYDHPAEYGYSCDSASGYPSYTRGK